MPTYDYRCDACEHAFDQFQSITAEPLKKCPSCGKSKLRRLIGTGGGIIFKGSGFYQTDYRSESYKKAADSDKPKTEGGTSGESKKADATPADAAKPAAKTETPAAKPESAAKSKSAKSSSSKSKKRS